MNFDDDVMKMYNGRGRNYSLPETWCVHAALGVVTEASELADQIRRSVFYASDLDRLNIQEELGDMLFYMEIIRRRLLPGVGWQGIVDANRDKLRKRYPEGFTPEAAQNRADKKGDVQ